MRDGSKVSVKGKLNQSVNSSVGPTGTRFSDASLVVTYVTIQKKTKLKSETKERIKDKSACVHVWVDERKGEKARVKYELT